MNVCGGFWEVETPAPPKFHDHEVGPPVEVSVNCTVWPAEGDGGLNEKFAAGPVEETVTVFVVVFDPPEFETVSETEYEPAVANVCVGFWEVETPAPPKFHDHEVGPPVEVSVN